MPDFSLDEIKDLPEVPTTGSPSNGDYVVRAPAEQVTLLSKDPEIVSQIWFKTPPLRSQVFQRIKTIQLFAESHDQGPISDEHVGNWTWFELAIYDRPTAGSPRYEEGVELVWRSHRNRFQTTSYDWKEGDVFRNTDDLLRYLRDGDVIVVRVCSRFAQRGIFVQGGFLRVEIGEKHIVHEAPRYSDIVSEIKNIHEALQEINASTNVAFQPKLPPTLFRADVLSTGGEPPIRVLSLDGGGVRGLASLHLLRAVMDKAAPGKKPCEVFDMIGGTSTGGLIAIMLGRLEMKITECIEKYENIMGDVFKSGFFGKNARFAAKGEFYDASVLENKIKDIIREKLNTDPENVPLYSKDHRCRIFCMAVRRDAANNHGPVFLRSYHNSQELSLLPDIKLWEAARATSAAPAYFSPIKVGDYELVDGGLQANNPLGWLWTEVLGVFGPARTTDCFLSIGTGIDQNTPLPKPGILGSHEVEKGLAGIATNTQIVHILFKTLLNAFAPLAQDRKYWRLNIGTEIPEHMIDVKHWPWPTTHEKVLDNYKPVGDLDDIAAVKLLVEQAKLYIEAQKGTIEECAAALGAHLS
ncbi:Hypothetical protein D9617_3g022810 [Elsinoe fawcettii]|nr:Hypothetical protein D9617_3g022810 [Elsinoe fawcettii]